MLTIGRFSQKLSSRKYSSFWTGFVAGEIAADIEGYRRIYADEELETSKLYMLLSWVKFGALLKANSTSLPEVVKQECSQAYAKYIKNLLDLCEIQAKAQGKAFDRAEVKHKAQEHLRMFYPMTETQNVSA